MLYNIIYSNIIMIKIAGVLEQSLEGRATTIYSGKTPESKPLIDTY